MILNLQGYTDRSSAGTKEPYIQHLVIYKKLHLQQPQFGLDDKD